MPGGAGVVAAGGTVSPDGGVGAVGAGVVCGAGVVRGVVGVGRRGCVGVVGVDRGYVVGVVDVGVVSVVRCRSRSSYAARLLGPFSGGGRTTTYVVRVARNAATRIAVEVRIRPPSGVGAGAARSCTGRRGRGARVGGGGDALLLEGLGDPHAQPPGDVELPAGLRAGDDAQPDLRALEALAPMTVGASSRSGRSPSSS